MKVYLLLDFGRNKRINFDHKSNSNFFLDAKKHETFYELIIRKTDGAASKQKIKQLLDYFDVDVDAIIATHPIDYVMNGCISMFITSFSNKNLHFFSNSQIYLTKLDKLVKVYLELQNDFFLPKLLLHFSLNDVVNDNIDIINLEELNIPIIDFIDRIIFDKIQ